MNCNNIVSTLLVHDYPEYVLFKIAIIFAEQGLNIWFISRAQFDKIPENIQQPCKEVLQLITFIYLKDYLDLVKHLNSIHKWENAPNLVIVKDFHRYCSLQDADYNALQSAFLSSILLDSVTFLARKKNCKTFLLVCCLNLNDKKIIAERLQVLYDMYFNNFHSKDNFNSEDDLIDTIQRDFVIN